MNAFETHLFIPLRKSNRYQISGIVEPSRLNTESRSKLMEFFLSRRQAWPLLQQDEFANIRDYGPWLISARAGAEFSGQWDFYSILKRMAGDALCGVTVSALAPQQLANHLSQANRVTAPDGHDYLLRYHTPCAIASLHSRVDLPSIARWLAPLYSWSVPGKYPDQDYWSYLPCTDRPEDPGVVRIELDQACWDALVGDPLESQLADLLEAPLATKGRVSNCHGTRLALVQQHLGEARKTGFTDQADLILYVSIMAVHAKSLHDSPGWKSALADASSYQGQLLSAVHKHLPSLSV